LREDGDFLSDELVAQRVPLGCAEFSSLGFPPVHHPERLPMARALLAQLLSKGRVIHARLCGDGVINYGLMADLTSHGIEVTRDDVESFFNLPTKSQ
jgi:hypothetical protein